MQSVLAERSRNSWRLSAKRYILSWPSGSSYRTWSAPPKWVRGLRLCAVSAAPSPWMASSISRQAAKGPSTTKSVSTPSRPSPTCTQSNTSKASANSAGLPPPAGSTRKPQVVSKKPRREKRSRSACISRCSAWKNASDGQSTGIGPGPKEYSRGAGRVKREVAVGGLGGGVERQGRFGELERAAREGEEGRGLAQHRGVDEEAP